MRFVLVDTTIFFLLVTYFKYHFMFIFILLFFWNYSMTGSVTEIKGKKVEQMKEFAYIEKRKMQW